MGSLVSPTHLLFIAAIALIFLGPKKLPELARSLGHGMREFRDSISGDSAHEDAVHDDAVATLPPTAEAHAPVVEPFAPTAGYEPFAPTAGYEPFAPTAEHEPLHAVPEPGPPAFPSEAPSQATPLRPAGPPEPPPPSAA
jgi:sec-independent protein translocase protein TatA